MNAPDAPSRLVVAAALAAVYLVWGSTYLAIAIGVQGYPPFAMGALRMLAAGALFYVVLRWRGVPPPTRAQWRNLAAMGVFMVLLANGLVNLAQTEVSSGLAAIAVASMPLYVAVLSTLKGRTLGALEWVGIAIGLGGVGLLHLGSELRGSWLGVTCLVVAPSLASTLALVYLALFGSIVGFTAYVWLLHNVRPAVATSYAYVNPAIAVLLGTVVLQERFDAGTWTAMVVILASVVLVMRTPKRA